MADDAVSHAFDRENLRRIVFALATETPITGAPLRGLGLPGVPGRSLWLVVNKADAEALAAHYVLRGQEGIEAVDHPADALIEAAPA